MDRSPASAVNPQVVSSICAVLAETDVINMVSRGISTPDILKGIHLSMAGRYLKLLRAIDAHGPVAITGGLSADTGLAQALQEKAREDGLEVEIRTHPQRHLCRARWEQRCGELIVIACSPAMRRHRHDSSNELAGKMRYGHRRLGRNRQRHRSQLCSKPGR